MWTGTFRGLVVALPFSASLVIVACGGSGVEHGGQSSLIDQTFAGANKCNAKNHNRPFIVEWDATDQSSFQARASSDVIAVKYEGCELKVLDGCVQDSVKGAFGSYKPIDWTSGQLEAIDIANQSDLLSKLPLGIASLGGRVQKGEKFHMEYYVSGTRSATREHLYRGALAKVPACAEATHFVYAYNLGAFALASSSNLKGEMNGSYFGFGANGTHSSDTRADKKGGTLASCTTDAVREVASCKVPIRLTLREISDGSDPDGVAGLAPETDRAANLAGLLRNETEQTKNAVEHGNAAREKRVAGDGSGCLAELDQHDKLDPSPSRLSTNPKGGELAHVRVSCILLSGKCDAGRSFGRQVLDAEGAAEVEAKLDGVVGEFCRSSDASSRDQDLHATYILEAGASLKPFPPAECRNAFDTITKLQAAGTSRSRQAPATRAAKCIARGGDCAQAFKLFQDSVSRDETAFDQLMVDPHLPPDSPYNIASCSHTSISSSLPGKPNARFKVSGDTVNDLRTGLTWQRVLFTRKDMILSEARSYCSGLSLAGGGWRLPGRDELMSIVDMTVRGTPPGRARGFAVAFAKIDETFFPATPAVEFLTSTPVSEAATWTVNFADGVDYHSASPAPVRCVRGKATNLTVP